MGFGPQLLTEPQARMLIPQEALVVRPASSFLAYPLLLAFTAFSVAFLSLPLWRDVWSSAPDVPSWFCGVAGSVLLLVSKGFWAQLRATRQPGAWVLAITRDRVWIKFRSYHHWRAPIDDKIVVQIDRLDIDRVCPRESRVRTGTPKSPRTEWLSRLDFLLTSPLSKDQVDAIVYENKRMFQGRFVKSRIQHTPVLVGGGGTVLMVSMQEVSPSLSAVLTALPSAYQVEPVQPLGGMAEGEDVAPFAVSDRIAAEIAALAQSGKTLEAICLMRAHTRLGLKEAKAAIEAGHWHGQS